MTKFNDTLKKFVDEWFKNKEELTRDEYKLLSKYAYEVLK